MVGFYTVDMDPKNLCITAEACVRLTCECCVQDQMPLFLLIRLNTTGS